jgi:predicted MFS family arabinose efflux permease
MRILNRDFILGFCALFSFLVACYALVPTLPIYLAALGSDETTIGLLVGVYSASALIFRFLVGGVLPRYTERTVMMFGALLFAVTFPASIIFHPFWPFFVVRFFQGIAYAALDTAVVAFIVNVIPPLHRVQGIAYFFMAPTLALALAPSFGMLLLIRHGITFLFMACLVLSLAAFFFSYELKQKRISAPDKGANPGNTLFFDAKIVVPTISAFLQSFVMGSLFTFLPLYAVRCGVSNPGHFFSAIAIVVIAGRVLGGRIVNMWKKEKVILSCVFTSGVSVTVLSFSTTLPMFIVVGLLWGVGYAFIFPAFMAYAFDYSGSSGGAAVGTFMAITDLGLALGPVLLGMVIPVAGYPEMFLCLALVCVVNVTYFQFYVRKKRNMALIAGNIL